MVSRIYTPYQPPINRPSVGKRDSQSNPEPSADGAPDGFNPQRQSRGLATVMEQAQIQKIHLDSILKDFKSTMSALGADSKVQTEVETYLHVIDLQAQKETPSVPLIKQTLKTAADSLDGYISSALGQPSRVVRDWVDALLLQNIHYRYGEDSGQEASSETPSGDGKVSGLLSETSNLKSELPKPGGAPSDMQDAGQSAFNQSDKEHLKAMIEKSRIAEKNGDWSGAEIALQSGLGILSDKNRPDLAGKVRHMLGRVYERQQKPDEAVAQYRQAAGQFAESGQPDKQSHVLYAMASVLDVKGDLPQAQAVYEEALTLDQQLGNTRSVTRILNDLGSVHLRAGDPGQAIERLKQAYREASRKEGDPTLIPDIFSNLGGAYRAQKQYRQSYNAYQVSLDRAIRYQDPKGAMETLENLASLSLDAQKPDKAMAFLKRAEELRKQFGQDNSLRKQFGQDNSLRKQFGQENALRKQFGQENALRKPFGQFDTTRPI